MNYRTMKSDVLLMPGNSDMFDNRPWFYNDQNMKEFHHAVRSVSIIYLESILCILIEFQGHTSLISTAP